MDLAMTAPGHEAGPTTVVAMSAGVTSATSSGIGRVIAPRRVNKMCPFPPEKPEPIPPADPTAAYCTFSVKCRVSHAPTGAPLASVTFTPLRTTKRLNAVPIAVSVAPSGHRVHDCADARFIGKLQNRVSATDADAIRNVFRSLPALARLI